jgi:hypothetical protein
VHGSEKENGSEATKESKIRRTTSLRTISLIRKLGGGFHTIVFHGKKHQEDPSIPISLFFFRFLKVLDGPYATARPFLTVYQTYDLFRRRTTLLPLLQPDVVIIVRYEMEEERKEAITDYFAQLLVLPPDLTMRTFTGNA